MRVLPLVRRIPDTIFATVAFVFIVYGMTQLLGFSGGIAALAFGVTLTNHERFDWIERLAHRTGAPALATLRPVEQRFFGEIVFLLKTLFFLYLGTSIRFADPRALLIALLVVALVYLARLIVTRFVGDRQMTVREAAITSVMVPKGLAAAVLATVPLQAGVPGGEVIRDVTFAVVVFSITATAVLGWAAERGPLAAAYGRMFTRFVSAALPAPATDAEGRKDAVPVQRANGPVCSYSSGLFRNQLITSSSCAISRPPRAAGAGPVSCVCCTTVAANASRSIGVRGRAASAFTTP
jgi:hypothetical protein